MAGSLNKVQLIGNTGQDPEVITTTNGSMCAKFSLAMSESWKDKAGEKNERTEWVRVVCWGDALAKMIGEHIKKGQQLYVEGKIVTREYEKDGEKRYATEVVVQGFDGKVMMLGRKDGPAKQADRSLTTATPPPARGNGAERTFDDEIPFMCEWR